MDDKGWWHDPNTGELAGPLFPDWMVRLAEMTGKKLGKKFVEGEIEAFTGPIGIVPKLAIKLLDLEDDSGGYYRRKEEEERQAEEDEKRQHNGGKEDGP